MAAVGAMPHMQADVSESALSIASSLGLEDLAAFVSRNSSTGGRKAPPSTYAEVRSKMPQQSLCTASTDACEAAHPTPQHQISCSTINISTRPGVVNGMAELRGVGGDRSLVDYHRDEVEGIPMVATKSPFATTVSVAGYSLRGSEGAVEGGERFVPPVYTPESDTELFDTMMISPLEPSSVVSAGFDKIDNNSNSAAWHPESCGQGTPSSAFPSESEASSLPLPTTMSPLGFPSNVPANDTALSKKPVSKISTTTLGKNRNRDFIDGVAIGVKYAGGGDAPERNGVEDFDRDSYSDAFEHASDSAAGSHDGGHEYGGGGTGGGQPATRGRFIAGGEMDSKAGPIQPSQNKTYAKLEGVDRGRCQGDSEMGSAAPQLTKTNSQGESDTRIAEPKAISPLTQGRKVRARANKTAAHHGRLETRGATTRGRGGAGDSLFVGQPVSTVSASNSMGVNDVEIEGTGCGEIISPQCEPITPSSIVEQVGLQPSHNRPSIGQEDKRPPQGCPESDGGGLDQNQASILRKTRMEENIESSDTSELSPIRVSAASPASGDNGDSNSESSKQHHRLTSRRIRERPEVFAGDDKIRRKGGGECELRQGEERTRPDQILNSTGSTPTVSRKSGSRPVPAQTTQIPAGSELRESSSATVGSSLECFSATPSLVGVEKLCGALSAWLDLEVVRPAIEAAQASERGLTADDTVRKCESREYQHSREYGRVDTSALPRTDRMNIEMTLAAEHVPVLENAGDNFGTASGNVVTAADVCRHHPARVFHLLWQRDRLRCPFSFCAIPDTVVFDSMGEAADWFFTSKREGGIKRKLTSNTRISIVFQEFAKGSVAESDPVAVLVTWTAALPSPAAHTIVDRAATRTTRCGVRNISMERHEARFEKEFDLTVPSVSTDEEDRSVEVTPATKTGIGHLTVRELHTFLFGRTRSEEGGTPTTGDAGGGEHIPSVWAPQPSAAGNVDIARDDFVWNPPFPTRSLAAAAAAARGGGYCLLQKYIHPTGARNSTLRCHWVSPPSCDLGRAPSSSLSTPPQHRKASIPREPTENGDPTCGTRGWECDAVTGNGGSWRDRPTAGLELGAAERSSVSGGIFERCVLDRSTNVFRAARRDLSCEDRCVTFEEPSQSSRWGRLWPRSTIEPLKTPVLRDTLVGACHAVSEHICQVSRGRFRPKGFSGYFRQGPDGKTYLMFISRWGEIPSLPLDNRCEPVLLRARATTERPSENHRNRQQNKPTTKALDNSPTTAACNRAKSSACWWKHHGVDLGQGGDTGGLSSMAVIGTGERRPRAPDMRAAGIRGSTAYRPGTSERGCPGCGRMNNNDISGVRSGGEARMMGGVTSVKRRCRRSTTSSTPWDDVDPEETSDIECRRDSGNGIVGTYFTTLGVVVDACMWETSRQEQHHHQQRQQPHPDENKGNLASAAVAAATAAILESGGDRPPRKTSLPQDARARIDGELALHRRVLSRIYPGLSLGRVANLCAEDLRLRLREIKVCRDCAISIAETSGEKMREADDIARRRAKQLAATLGLVDPPSLTKRQRKAKLADDIAAFRDRLSATTIAPNVPSSARAFGGGRSRIEYKENCTDDGAGLRVGCPHRPTVSNRVLHAKPCPVRPKTTDETSSGNIQAYKHASRKMVSATDALWDSAGVAADSDVLSHARGTHEARAASPAARGWLAPSRSLRSPRKHSRGTASSNPVSGCSGNGVMHGEAGIHGFDGGAPEDRLREWASVLTNCKTVEDANASNNNECSRGVPLQHVRTGDGGGGGGGDDGDGTVRLPEDGAEDGKTHTSTPERSFVPGEGAGVACNKDGIVTGSPRRGRTPHIALSSPRTTPTPAVTTTVTIALHNRKQQALHSEDRPYDQQNGAEVRKFYDPSEAALRNRKLQKAYSAGFGPRYGSNERTPNSRGQRREKSRASKKSQSAAAARSAGKKPHSPRGSRSTPRRPSTTRRDVGRDGISSRSSNANQRTRMAARNKSPSLSSPPRCSSKYGGIEIDAGGSSSGGVASGDIACLRKFAEANVDICDDHGGLGAVVACDEKCGSAANERGVRRRKGDASPARSDSSYDVYSGGEFVPEECIVMDGSEHDNLDDEVTKHRTLSCSEVGVAGDVEDWQEGGLENFASTIVETGRDDVLLPATNSSSDLFRVDTYREGAVVAAI